MKQVYHDAGDATPAGDERAFLREQLIGPGASRALAFQTVAVRHFGPAAGIFLRQLLYRDGSGWDGDFWIYKSMKEWDEETGLKRRQQERARKVLTGKGVMEEKKANGPDVRQRLFFRVDPWAVMEILGDELPRAQPSTNAQGCTVLPDKDHVQYYQAGTMPGISAPAVQKTTQKISPKGADALSQQNEEIRLDRERMTDLTRRFKKTGVPLTDEDRDSIAGNLTHCITNLGAKEDELELVKSKLTYRRREGAKVMPSQILEEVRAESNTSKALGTPPEAIEALRVYRSEKTGSTHLRSYVGLAKRFDFTSEEKPDWKIMNEISPDRQEQQRLLKTLRSFCKRVVKEAAREEAMAKMAPFKDTESPATAARMDFPGLKGNPEGLLPRRTQRAMQPNAS